MWRDVIKVLEGSGRPGCEVRDASADEFESVGFLWGEGGWGEGFLCRMRGGLSARVGWLVKRVGRGDVGLTFSQGDRRSSPPDAWSSRRREEICGRGWWPAGQF